MSDGIQSHAQHGRVLIVDDDPTLRIGFQIALETEGHETECAKDGAIAIERLLNEQAEEIDLVVLDLRMPRKDGISVIRELRANNKVVPIILVSASIDSPTAMRAVGYGVVDFLKKPTTPDDIRKIVAEVIASESRLSKDGVGQEPTVKRAIRHLDLDLAAQLIRESSDSKDLTIWQFLVDHLIALRDHTDSEANHSYSHFYSATDIMDFLTR